MIRCVVSFTSFLMHWFCWLALFASALLASAAFESAASASENAAEQASAIRVLGSNATEFSKAKACQQLALVGDSNAVQALSELLGHPRLADYALSALIRIPGPQVDNALLASVSSLRERSLIGVLHAIGQRQVADAVLMLQSEFGKRKWSETELLAAIQMLGAIGTSQAESTLQQMSVADRSGRYRRVHADAIKRCQSVRIAGLPNQVSSDLLQLQADLQAGDGEYRDALLKARRLGAVAAPDLALSLRTAEPSRQVLTLICLAELENRQVLDLCRPLMQSKQAEVAATAVDTVVALGGFVDADRLPDFVRQRPEQAVSFLRSIAAAENIAIDSQVIGMIQEMAKGADAEPRWRSAVIQYAMQRRLSEVTLPLLQLAALDGETAQAFLMAAAATVKVDQFSAFLAKVSEVADDDPGSASQVLQSALVHLPQDATAESLGTAIGASRMPGRRDWLMDQLAFLGGQRALAFVVAYAQSGNGQSLGDEESVDAATRVLGAWTTADVATPLLQLADQLPAGKYQLRALRGYLRVGRQLDMDRQDRLQLCKAGWQRAQRDDERLLVLDILRRFSSEDGMNWLVDLLKGSSQSSKLPSSKPVRNHAFVALAHVAGRIALDDPNRVKQVLAQLDLTQAPASARAALEVLR